MQGNLSDLLREKIKHGSDDYPIGFYICSIPESYHYLTAHWHEEFECTLIKSGSLHYMIGPNHYVVKEGDLLFIPPDMLHSAHQIDDLTAETLTVVFHLNLLGLDSKDLCTRKYIEKFQNGSFLPIAVVSEDHSEYQKLRECFDLLWKCQEQQSGTGLVLKSTLYRLFYLLWQIDPDSSSAVIKNEVPTAASAERIKPVLSFIREHYTEPLSIEELADYCGFSQVHFMNIFKKITGTSCLEYIIEYRLSMALADLQETDQPVMKIAMEHGFQNISYFNRVFHKKIGMTPSQYRKKYR